MVYFFLFTPVWYHFLNYSGWFVLETLQNFKLNCFGMKLQYSERNSNSMQKIVCVIFAKKDKMHSRTYVHSCFSFLRFALLCIAFHYLNFTTTNIVSGSWTVNCRRLGVFFSPEWIFTTFTFEEKNKPNLISHSQYNWNSRVIFSFLR